MYIPILAYGYYSINIFELKNVGPAAQLAFVEIGNNKKASLPLFV
jgi:hypothetical protein